MLVAMHAAREASSLLLRTEKPIIKLRVADDAVAVDAELILAFKDLLQTVEIIPNARLVRGVIAVRQMLQCEIDGASLGLPDAGGLLQGDPRVVDAAADRKLRISVVFEHGEDLDAGIA